jgi:hypothetical protein
MSKIKASWFGGLAGFAEAENHVATSRQNAAIPFAKN